MISCGFFLSQKREEPAKVFAPQKSNTYFPGERLPDSKPPLTELMKPAPELPAGFIANSLYEPALK